MSAAARALVLGAVSAERTRQEGLVASGKFRWTCASGDVSDEAKLTVLGEEFGEVAREVCRAMCEGEAPDRDALRAELVQVAAVAVAWAEAIAEETW